MRCMYTQAHTHTHVPPPAAMNTTHIRWEGVSASWRCASFCLCRGSYSRLFAWPWSHSHSFLTPFPVTWVLKVGASRGCHYAPCVSKLFTHCKPHHHLDLCTISRLVGLRAASKEMLPFLVLCFIYRAGVQTPGRDDAFPGELYTVLLTCRPLSSPCPRCIPIPLCYRLPHLIYRWGEVKLSLVSFRSAQRATVDPLALCWGE